MIFIVLDNGGPAMVGLSFALPHLAAQNDVSGQAVAVYDCTAGADSTSYLTARVSDHYTVINQT